MVKYRLLFFFVKCYLALFAFPLIILVVLRLIDFTQRNSLRNQYMNDNSDPKQFTFNMLVSWIFKDLIIKLVTLVLYLNWTQPTVLTNPQIDHLVRICGVSALLNLPLFLVFKLKKYRKTMATLAFCIAWNLKDYAFGCFIFTKSRRLMPPALGHVLRKLGYAYLTRNLFVIFYGSLLAICVWVFFYADTEILNHYTGLNLKNFITWVLKDLFVYWLLKHTLKDYFAHFKNYQNLRYLQLQDFAMIFWTVSIFNWVWVLLFSLLNSKGVQAFVICASCALKDYLAYSIVFYCVYPWFKIELVSYAFLTPNYNTFFTVLFIPIIIDLVWAYFFVATNEFEE